MGGWSTVVTQNTEIHPQTIKEARILVVNLLREYRLFCEEQKLEGMTLISPVGSAHYFNEDLISNPARLYGDIDFLILYPGFPEPGKENKAITEENKRFMEWLSISTSPYAEKINYKETKKCSKSAIKLITNGKEPMQIDFMPTFKEYMYWAKLRYTPIRNQKGFVIGVLYTSLGKVFGFSMGPYGARIKWRDGKIVSSRYRKNVTTELITTDYYQALEQVAKYFTERSGNDFSKTSIVFTGFNPIQNTLTELLEEVGRFCDYIEEIGFFPTKEKGEFRQLVYDTYCKALEAVMDNSKFEKAKTDLAKHNIRSVKKNIKDAKLEAKVLVKDLGEKVNV